MVLLEYDSGKSVYAYNKVNMFTHCYFKKKIRTCTCILVYTNIALLVMYVAILTKFLLILNGIMVFRF